MDSYIALTLFGCFFVLVFIGVPISFSIGIATVASMLLMFPGISRQSLFRSDWLMDWITLPYWQSPFHLCRNADEQRRYCDTLD